MSKNGKNETGSNQRLISLVFLLVVVAAIAGYIPVRNAETEVADQYGAHAAEVAKLLSAELDRAGRAVRELSLEERLRDRSAWYRAWEDNDIVRALNEHVEKHDIFSLVLLVDTKGQLIAANNIDGEGHPFDATKLYLGNFGATPWFSALERDNFMNGLDRGAATAAEEVPLQIEDLHVDETVRLCDLDASGRTLGFSSPVYEDGKVIAYVSQRVRFDAVEEFCGFLRQSSDRLVGDLNVMLVDGSARLLAEFTSGGARERIDEGRDFGALTAGLDNGGVKAVHRALRGETGFTWRFTPAGGERRIAAFAPVILRGDISSPQWSVFLTASRDRVLAATGIVRTQRVMAGIFGLLVLLILGVIALVRRDRTKMTVRKARRQAVLAQARAQAGAEAKPLSLEILGVKADPLRAAAAAGGARQRVKVEPVADDGIDEWRPDFPVRRPLGAAAESEPEPSAPAAEPVTPAPVEEPSRPATSGDEGLANTRRIKKQLEELSRTLLEQDTIADGLRAAREREQVLAERAAENRHELERLEREHEEAESACVRARDRLETARSRCAKLDRELAAASGQKSADEATLETMRAEAEEVRQEAERTRRENEALRSDLADTRGECAELRRQAAALLVEANTLCEQVTQLRNDIVALSREKERSEVEVAMAKDEAEHARKAALEERIRAARTRHEGLAMTAAAAAGNGATRSAEQAVTPSVQPVQPAEPRAAGLVVDSKPAAGFKTFNAPAPAMKQRSVMTYALEDLARDLSEATGEEVEVTEYDVEAMRLQVNETKMKSVARRPNRLGDDNAVHGGGVRQRTAGRLRRSLPTVKGAGA